MHANLIKQPYPFPVLLLIAECKQTPVFKIADKDRADNLEKPHSAYSCHFRILHFPPPCKHDARPGARLSRLRQDLFSHKYWLNSNSIYSLSLSVSLFSIFRCPTCPPAVTFTLRIPNIKQDGTSNISWEKVSEGSFLWDRYVNEFQWRPLILNRHLFPFFIAVQPFCSTTF